MQACPCGGVPVKHADPDATGLVAEAAHTLAHAEPPSEVSGEAWWLQDGTPQAQANRWYAGLDTRTANILRGVGGCRSRDDAFRLVINNGLHDLPGLGERGIGKVRAWLALGPGGTIHEPSWRKSTAAAVRFLESRGYLVVARVKPPAKA